MADDSSVPTRGAVTISCKSVNDLDNEIRKYTAKRGSNFTITALRASVAHAVDTDVSTAADDCGVPESEIVSLLEWLDRAAQRQFPDRY